MFFMEIEYGLNEPVRFCYTLKCLQKNSDEQGGFCSINLDHYTLNKAK